MVGGRAVKTHLPEMVLWYRALVPLISVVTFQDVVVSPYPESDINVLLYDRPGRHDRLASRYQPDHVPPLLDGQHGGRHGVPTFAAPARPGRDAGASRPPPPRAVLLMQGRQVWHRSQPIQREQRAAPCGTTTPATICGGPPASMRCFMSRASRVQQRADAPLVFDQPSIDR